MLSGDRGKRIEGVIVTGFCISVIIGAVVLLYSIGLLNGEQSERRQNYPHTHSETAKQKAERSCVGANPDAVFECVIGYVEASEETAYAEQDLTAQQRAAWGALIAAFASILSVGVSLLGLYWIKGTLDATRDVVGESVKATCAMQESNKIALSALKAQYRPDIEITISGPYGWTVNRADPFAFPDGERAAAGIMQEARIYAQCKILNRGVHPITIHEASIQILGGDGAAPQSTYYRLEPTKYVIYNNNVLPFGGELNVQWPTDYIAVPDSATLNEIFANPPPVIGHIIHQDQLGVKRKLKFAFTPSPVIRSQQYRLWGGSDYNYETELPD